MRIPHRQDSDRRVCSQSFVIDPFFLPLLILRITVVRRVLGEEDRLVMSAMGNLAVAFPSLGKEAEAEARYREALELRRRILGNEHGSTPHDRCAMR